MKTYGILTWLCLIAFSVFLCGTPTAAQMPPPPAGQSSRLTLDGVTGHGDVRAGTSLTAWDFGHADAATTKVITHAFLLRNNNSRAVTISRVHGSCGCTTGVIVEAAGKPTLVVSPGQTIHVAAKIDAARLRFGSLDKFISIFIRGQAWPAATLEITGNWQAVHPAAKARPSPR